METYCLTQDFMVRVKVRVSIEVISNEKVLSIVAKPYDCLLEPLRNLHSTNGIFMKNKFYLCTINMENTCLETYLVCSFI